MQLFALSNVVFHWKQEDTSVLKRMKSPDRATISRLTDLPNIGKAMAEDLRLVGIGHSRDLIGKDAYQLYDELCEVTGKKHDPCVIDVFLSVVDFMAGGAAKPWWEFTAERKEYDRRL